MEWIIKLQQFGVLIFTIATMLALISDNRASVRYHRITLDLGWYPTIIYLQCV